MPHKTTQHASTWGTTNERAFCVVGLWGPSGLMVNDAFQQCNSQFNNLNVFMAWRCEVLPVTDSSASLLCGVWGEDDKFATQLSRTNVKLF